MDAPVKKVLPAIPAVALLLALVFFVLRWSLRLTEGHFTYALDDAYIHMAIARTLVEHGVWGVTPSEFTSASSSPVWTLMLAACFSILGVTQTVPLVLCVLFAVGLLLFANRVLLKAAVPPLPRAAALVWLVLAAPMTPIMFQGMEHVAQILASLVFVALAADVMTRGGDGLDRHSLGLVASAALTTAVRYEGIALVAIVCVLLAVRCQWRSAGAVLLAGVLPILAFGAYSLSQGGLFIPNSVLIKSAEVGLGLAGESLAAFAMAVGINIRDAYPLVAMMSASLLLTWTALRQGFTFWTWARVFAAITVATATVHIVLGSVYFRYVAYLMVLVSVGLILQLHEWWTLTERRNPRWTRPVYALLSLLLLMTAAGVMWRIHGSVPASGVAMRNIYEQHIQMARFVQSADELASIALNDLGAVAFFNPSVTIVDLIGLGMRRPVPEMFQSHAGIGSAEMARLAREAGATMAILYPEWFDEIPADWTPVGAWTISDNVAAGKDTVVFYAIPPQNPARIEQELDRFRPDLPSSVRVREFR